jgi:hypothetical protein
MLSLEQGKLQASVILESAIKLKLGYNHSKIAEYLLDPALASMLS